MFEIERIWRRKFENAFNVVRIGRPFQQSTSGVVIGSVDGVIRVIDGEGKVGSTQENTFETKGGCIQAIQFQDLTKFGGQDLIVGDSDGSVTVFSNSEILNKRTLSSAVTTLVIDSDLGGNVSIIAGDRMGVISALKPHELLWRVKLNEDPSCLREPSLGVPLDLSIRCLSPLRMVDKYGIVSRLLLVTTTNSNKLHLYNQGMRVLTVFAPSSITAICTGVFTNDDDEDSTLLSERLDGSSGKRRRIDEATSSNGSSSTEVEKGEKEEEEQPEEAGGEEGEGEEKVVVGCEDGFLYLFNAHSMQFSRHAKVGFAPTKIQACSISSEGTRGRGGRRRRKEVQLVVCSGPFDGLKVFHEGELVLEQKTDDWVHTFDVGDVDDDQRTEIVVGTLERELICYRITKKTDNKKENGKMETSH